LSRKDLISPTRRTVGSPEAMTRPLAITLALATFPRQTRHMQPLIDSASLYDFEFNQDTQPSQKLPLMQ